MSTPEKWEAYTRFGGSVQTGLLAAVQLVLLDEVHLVGDAHRGPAQRLAS